MFLAFLPERSIYSSDLLTQTLSIMSLRNRESSSVGGGGRERCVGVVSGGLFLSSVHGRVSLPKGPLRELPFERNVVLGYLLSPARE